jgi:branched-chain amino acid transport system permease protein
MMRHLAPLLLFAAVVGIAWLPGLPPFWLTLLDYIGLASIVALGLVVLTGVGNVTSFGQAMFVGVGAYATAILSTRYGWSPWATLPVAVLLAAALAWVVGAITLRLSGHYLPLGTLAWNIGFFYVLGNLDLFGRYDGISGIPPLAIGDFSLVSSASVLVPIWGALALLVIATSSTRASAGRSGP